MLGTLFPQYTDRMTLALSGVFQASSLVASLAKTGACAPGIFDFMTSALLNTEPESDEELFGQDCMRTGLQTLLEFCRPGGTVDHQLLQHSLGILRLHKLLHNNHQMQRNIRATLHTLEDITPGDQPIAQDHLVRQLARLYIDNLGTLGFRIQVAGNPHFLQQDMVTARVRVMLFAGIRFAHLWRQAGGREHHLLTAKKTIAARVSMLLNP